MSAQESVSVYKIIQALRSMKHNIEVSSTFEAQMEQIKALLKNDETGLVNTILDFMINSGNTTFTIETKNETLNNNLQLWQKYYLNKDINIDIPRGLKELSNEYFRERWFSSFIVLNIKWEKISFEDKTWIAPTRMWFTDGSSIKVKGSSSLNGQQYYIETSKGNQIPIVSTKDISVIIRKPFNAWYDKYPTPYLVKKGVLFNALLKKAIISKQADVIEQIVPYLLLMSAGSDKLAEAGINTKEAELKNLKEAFVKAIQEHDITGDIGKLIGTLSHDTKLEHFIPDLTKVFDKKIVEAVDKNILAGLGLIELIGFSTTRQEALLNPKVLIEEVKDGISDWTSILEEVMFQLLDKNKNLLPKLSNASIRVDAGTIKAFLTDKMKDMLRAMFDRGVLDTMSFVDDVADKNIDTILERRDREAKDNYETRLYPRKISNQEQYPNVPDNPDPTGKKESTGKKPGTPEAKTYKRAEEIEIDTELLAELELDAEKTKLTAPYSNIDELPEGVRSHLPVSAQLIFLRVVNEALKRGLSDSEAFREAWGVVKKSFKKSKDGKWTKK